MSPISRHSLLTFSLLTVVSHPLWAEPKPEEARSSAPGIARVIRPMEGTAWVEEEGMRIAWIRYKHIDDKMLENLIDARANYEPVPHETFYEDPQHVKLCDGRAYGYFNTTVAWSKEVDRSDVVFDLHRPYHITKVEIAQPSKLEDRHGGPTQLEVGLAMEKDSWSSNVPLKAVFPVWTQKDEEPIPRSFVQDKRHQRAWLSWTTGAIEKPARWVRVRLQRVRPNSHLSFGQVVISGYFDGEIKASLQDSNEMRMIAKGRKYLVPRR